MNRKETIMIEIKGTYNTAICFTDEIEDQAYEQIKHLCDSKEYENSKIRIMPDVHAGKGCTIGSTITFTNKINPLLITDCNPKIITTTSNTLKCNSKTTHGSIYNG